MSETQTAVEPSSDPVENSAPQTSFPISVSSSRRHLLVDGKTLAEAYLRRVEISANDPAYLIKRNGKYESFTWQEVNQTVIAVARGLRQQGIKKGDKVCIMGNSRAEWTMTDLAIMFSGAVTVPIYQSSAIEDITFILDNCEAKLVFADDITLYAKLTEAMAQLNKSIPVVLFSDQLPAKTETKVSLFKDFAKRVDDPTAVEEFRSGAMAVTPGDIASIVYTSGTTGRPKGVVLLHSNFSGEARSIISEIEVSVDDRTVTFLPFAHIFGRIESLLPISAGLTLAFAENINSVPQNIVEVKPTVLLSVPRIYEKIYTKIQSDVESQPEYKKNIFRWAVKVGREVARIRARKQPVPVGLSLKYKIAESLVFNKIREKLGGNLRFTISGGAPLSPELCELFHACGIKILEGYGLTETTAAITVNRPDDYVFGTVGRPLGQIQIRIAEDGEIQSKGPMIFKEYYRNPEATQEVFTSDGWFCTGDIGEFDNRGFLKITDRKKELIVTSGGKKIAPQKLENMMKGSRFISQGMVYGDKQKYLIALITLNEAEVKTWAKNQNLQGIGDGATLAKNEAVNKLIEGEVKNVNSELASFESIKKFRILPADFTVETGELTPSLKVKRKVVVQKYQSVIDELYH